MSHPPRFDKSKSLIFSPEIRFRIRQNSLHEITLVIFYFYTTIFKGIPHVSMLNDIITPAGNPFYKWLFTRYSISLFAPKFNIYPYKEQCGFFGILPRVLPK
ncbi:1063_t:CDS:2 [Funneliformis mosseae]|uniref:1063_t:CDS:1 n=1 Tax=Funneliformis mosseae TaxID=27381 RepID=A0A9N8ZZ08_FUNMO|nr:1063_t:CDS:2 [Funneliformis mosseae]